MKKRILALLLAGLLTASLASCVTSSNRPDNTSGDQTEPGQTTAPVDPVDPTVEWNTVDQTVYVVVDSLDLVPVEAGGTTVKASLMDELKRVKISKDQKTSMVEKGGVQYTVLSSNLSADDLLGKSFTACEPKTMYANGSVRIRKYASSSLDCSKIIKTLSTNDEVTVVAEGAKWSKIKYAEDTYYFVFSENLSDAKVVDYDKEDYSSYFTECERTTMYVTANALRVYCNASFYASEIAWPVKDDEVIVIATGTIDGTNWSKILIPDEVEAGATQTYTPGYTVSKHLSTSKGSTSITLEDMLLQYPEFEAGEKSMYVKKETTLTVRSTPVYPSETNKVTHLSALQAVKVVATATIDDMRWAMIEHTVEGEKGYYFVGASYLTPNEDGSEAPLTLDELLEKYDFEDCEDTTVYATGAVKCNTEPKNQTNVTKQLAEGDAVTLLAKGTVDYVEWYLFQIEGDSNYYFAGATLFETAAE